jgi:hypothetical protein
MKQTAVEWLVSVILDESFQEFYAEEIAQAKEMEKKQIMGAWVDGDNSDCLSEQDSSDFAEQYYNKTFNNKEK